MIPHDFNQFSVPNKNLETESAGCPNKPRPAPRRDTENQPSRAFYYPKVIPAEELPMKFKWNGWWLCQDQVGLYPAWSQPPLWPEAHHSFLGFFLVFFFLALPLHQTLLQKGGRRLWNIRSCRVFSTTQQTGHTFQSAGHVLSHRETIRFQSYELITNWWESVYSEIQNW